MATNQDEKAAFSGEKQTKDTLFIVRSPLEINELANVKNQENGNRSKPCDTLAQPAPESTAERLAQKPTSGSASSPTGSPKSADIAAPSAGVSAVNDLEANYIEASRAFNEALDAREEAYIQRENAELAVSIARFEFQKAWNALANS